MKIIVVVLTLLSLNSYAEECPKLSEIFKNNWKETTEEEWKPMSVEEWDNKWGKTICHKNICNGDIVSLKGKTAEVIAYKDNCTWSVKQGNNIYFLHTEDIK